jgi:hypothetical protein
LRTALPCAASCRLQRPRIAGTRRQASAVAARAEDRGAFLSCCSSRSLLCAGGNDELATRVNKRVVRSDRRSRGRVMRTQMFASMKDVKAWHDRPK